MRILVIGAGPTGLGAAWRLRELGHQDWHLYEKNDYAGGHAASHRDSQGFLWDEGGHVIFSHYRYFDQLVEGVLSNEYCERIRESWVYTRGLYVPYPFQNNIRYLPKDALLECLVGLLELQGDHRAPPRNYHEWILATFGEGLAHHFMLPYNRKVWGVPLERMGSEWIAERVSVVNFKRLLSNVIMDQDDVSWGPNSKFRFPRYGGTGEIYRRMASSLSDKVSYGKELTAVDLGRGQVEFADGSGDRYDVLITTLPLNLLVAAIRDVPPEIQEKAALLEHNDLVVVGVGLAKKNDTSKCWIYFPDADAPFYRVTHFSSYSPDNVPCDDIEKYSSLMCEITHSSHRPANQDRVVQDTLNALIRAGIMAEQDRSCVVSTYSRFVEYSYPIPTLRRDEALTAVQPFLESRKVFSRGRFGAWKYEIGNMDHSVMQGVEVVERVLAGKAETVWTP